MNGTKKLLVRIFVALYGLSYLLQNTFFIDRKKVYAATTDSTTNIVAVFVDKEIYQNIETNLKRYTTEYIQQKIGNSKAVIFPIDVMTMKAHEISQMLENIYFEGLKNESSKLVGTILIGDIPLPVVENNGFVYPSIYPYVDFENQQFIYDTNNKFFVYNNVPNGQAELRHGLIKFDGISEYNKFFQKIKDYTSDPTTFIDKAIRYEDFIGLKKYFIPENTKYYINSIIFSEDIGYHRFNNLLLNMLKNEHNDSALTIGNDLNSDLQNVEDLDLKAYADDIESRNNEAAGLSEQMSSNIPTMTLKTATKEMLKGYDGLFSSQFLAKIKDNVAGLARRYKSTAGETFTEYSSLTNTIAQKDNRVLGDIDNNIQPLLIQMNDFMESELNTKIETEKYYLTIPIPVSKLEYEGQKKGIKPLKKCLWKKYNYYENYYFGTNANQITNAQQTSAYRGTYQNLTSIAGQSIAKPLQSIGGSYDIFSTQVEANRGYNINSTKDEIALYDGSKTNRQDLRYKKCNFHLFGYCIGRKKKREVKDSNDGNKCYTGNIEKQGGCETMKEFAQRYRGGASVMNIDSKTQKLSDYNYRDAILPIYDIVGSKSIDSKQPDANSYSGAMTYANLIQQRFSVKEKQEASNSLSYLIDTPLNNGIDVKFTNKLPTDDLENPTRTYNAPQGYAQNNFFTIFTLMPNHTFRPGRAILYQSNAGDCGGNGSIYTYKTIDSRVKNISPTWDQISSTDFFKFKDGSSLENFYNNVLEELSGTQNDIINKNKEFNGVDTMDLTGVVSNLTQIKTIVASGNNGISTILTFLPTNLLSMNSSQVANLANDRSGKNLNSAKITELTERISKASDGLDALLSFMNDLSINNVALAFNNIIQSEAFKTQKVEILDTWKTNMTHNLDSINTDVNILESSFTNAQNIYNSIGNLNNNIGIIASIQAQKAIISALQLGNGCSANYYGLICNILDNLINTLQTDLNGTSVNDLLTKIHIDKGDDNGTPVIVQPFVEISQAFSPANVSIEIAQTKTVMNTFDISTDPNKKEKNKGMNLTTQDRPIDNIRNITFKGIGGEVVRLDYPNLYEVNVFEKTGDTLILKTPEKIREAIVKYLREKAGEYNTLLNEQITKRNNGYYNSLSAQFNFLGQLDPLANPNTHTYSLNSIPADFFITKMIDYLDTLEAAPEYGKKAIYGVSEADTTDEKLDMVAKLLYYQNITWPERMQQSGVIEDITEIKTSFDINQKTSYIINTYLKQGNDQGKFITPTYNSTGYEIGYINSDGEDYISANVTPTFIQQIQSAQATKKNIFVEAPENDLQKEVDSCEGIDTDGTSLLFDFKTFSSPWGKAMKCRIKKILKKPFKIEVSFKNADGPVFAGIFKEIGSSFENWKSEREEYGNERGGADNDATINQTEGKVKDILKGYNNNAIVNIDKTIIGVENTGNALIKIGMMKDLGEMEVKISGTGNNCFAIYRNGTELSPNICTKEAKEYYNPNTQDYVFEIVIKDKKPAGNTSLKIDFCPHLGGTIDLPCITKQQVVNIIPGPIDKIDIKTPTNLVMEGAELPIVVNAEDAYGNTIGQSIQAYTIRVNSGNGKISDGTVSNQSINFDNFLKAGFIYQAPIGLSENTKTITIMLEPNQTTKRLGANESITTAKIAQIPIEVAKGRVTVLQNNIVLYQSQTNRQINQPKITFNLPKEESDIQYMDADGMPQIKPGNVASITINIKDIQKQRPLNTVANITSKQGLLKPGTMEKNIITTATGTKTQFIFKPTNDFIIDSGTKSITLYPSFKAGNDTITINIPGIDPIIIPVVVNPGRAKTVLMKLEKSRLDFTSTTSSKGTIQVVDSRNNKVTTGTTIKLGVIGSASTNVSEFVYTGSEYTYTVTAKKPGGEGYVFAYINLGDRILSDQGPAYERFIVQDNILPKEKLNVMYLNLFGTDRGNQRGYFSENDKMINTVTAQSNKLLATTTELVDPSKIKQIEYIVNPNGQIQSIGNKESTLTINNERFIVQLSEIGEINLGATKNFKIDTVADTGSVSVFGKDTNTVLYIPEPTDSIITANDTTKSKIIINQETVIDTEKGSINPGITITADNETLVDMGTYTVAFNGKKIGTLMIRSKDSITANTANIDIQDPMTYGQIAIFSEGSTNTQGIGIYVQTSAFTKQGYQSIEDSADALLGIGFTNDFKNVANFANGKSVGEATLPYGSQFLINFGDPLLERREKNPNIPDTDFDASIGQTIYADPNKTIFKTLPIDFNNDGLKDIIVVYTDGVVKLLKNYGGTHPYKNMQELMIITEPIKEIKIGDVDGNDFEDIFIITNNNKGIVYLNDKGIFPVDGKNVCLNTNVEPDEINKNPEDFSNIKQIFVQDMDNDGKIDITTNDTLGDVKIFYGGGNSDGASYVSSITGICDDNRYQRQKNNYKILKRFGIKVNSSRYIQDDSLIHRKGAVMPTEGITEETLIDDSDTTANMSKNQLDALKDQTMNDLKTMIANTDMYVAAGSSQLAYTDNPLSISPIYESLSPTEIAYLPINETNDAVSIYKEYADINGGVLRLGDEVVIKTTIISKKNYNKLTYIDQLLGPRAIAKDDDNKITSLVFTTNNTGGLLIDRNGPEGYQFVMDNIQLNSGAKLSFSYTVTYQQVASTTMIDVKDQDLLKKEKYKDTSPNIYPDISIYSTDSCLKSRWILFNEKTGNKRTYEQVYDDMQQDINTYNSGAATVQQNTMNALIDQLSSTDSLQSISELPGLDNLEGRSTKSIINSLFSQGGLSLNINTNFIDDATAGVSKKIDAALQGLCQGFKLGKGGSEGCSGIPVPFNQAFLAPGDYHIFGCVPKLPNPLYAAFRTLNNTLGKGMPLLNIPGNRGPTPIGAYIPAPGFFGYPFKGATDGFYLGNLGGTYPSQFRLYIAPTLTLGLGIAMCFGPYTVGKALPKPFRDMGGNCVVLAVPPLTSCGNDNGGIDNRPAVDSVGSSIVNAGKIGTCNNPPKIGNTVVFVENTTQNNNSNINGDKIIVSTANSPFQIVAAGSNENNPSYSAAIPQGNFGGLVSIDQDPIRVSAEEDYGNATKQLEETIAQGGYELKKGEKIKLKIVGAKTKGLVKCMVQSWMTRQIQYIQNNLTKMTIQLDLPDMSTVFQGFDKIGNLEETYKSLNTQDKAEGYITSTEGQGVDTNLKDEGGFSNRTQYLSKQQFTNFSKQIGENPFEAIKEIFKEVPLINIDTKEINLKIPAITSDDINKYVSYLQLWVLKNEQILEDRTNMTNQILAMCGTTDKAEAKKMKAKLEIEKTADYYEGLGQGEKNWIEGQIKDMDAILALSGNTTWQEMGSDIKNIGINGKNTATKIGTLPYWKRIQTKLMLKKKGQNTAGLVSDTEFSAQDQARLDAINGIVNNLEKCANVAGGLDGLLKFRENTAGLISSIKENIKVLEKYKKFPTQLYQWTHITDKYLTEISSLISDTLGSLTSRLDINANRFSQYVDAIILLVGAIKSWQAIIDFSVKRSEKCSKCSNDNYGSFSCSLSFLCPKLPIFPIPAFKIPSIYMDLSHMELGMNITLPKINFVPINIPLPQIPNLPEPPTLEVDWDIMYGLNLSFFEGMSLPTIPVIPEPPTLPEPPSFIPTITMQLPVLPPAPKIPKILPEINAILKVGKFIGKVFCIVKGGIGLVGEKGVKGKIEQLTQRTWNVPIFDYFNLTTKFQDPPLQGFDYKLDAYTTLKFNFDGVYDVFNNIAQITNGIVSEKIEGPIKKAVDRTTEKANNNDVTDVINKIENLDQNINFNGYMKPEEETTGMMEYTVAYNELRQGLIQFKNDTLEDKTMNNRVKTILATVENKSTVSPATSQIHQVEQAAQGIIDQKRKENETMEKEIKDYDTFIKKLKGDNVILVDSKTISTTLKTPILTIDSPTRNILQSQEDPTKTYLNLNKKMVQGYLDAVNNDGPEKLNMSASTYSKSKKYLETTKEKIDTALLAYDDTPTIVAQNTCTNCSDEANNYSTDISMYAKGVFIESYSGDENSSDSVKYMVNTVVSAEQVDKVETTYTTDIDLNNDTLSDIMMYDSNTIYVKYAQQESEYFSEGNNVVTNNYHTFYSYANEHPGNIFNQGSRYIRSLDQLRNNSDQYGYTKIGNITIKVVDTNKEVKNFKTEGQTFDNLQLSRKNSKLLGESVDGYIIKVSNKIDDKDTPRNTSLLGSLIHLLGTAEKPKYILVLPQDTDYKKGLLTIDENWRAKQPINLELGNSILAVEYYDPGQDSINVTFKDLPRKRLYVSLASLTLSQDDLTESQRKSFTLYKKTSPRSNQTVAGMQNLGDTTGPVGEITLRRNRTNEVVNTGVAHEGYINTNYTLKSLRTDNVIVARMEIWKDGVFRTGKDNTSQTGTIDLGGLFFTGTAQQNFDFIAIDQNNNIAKEHVTLDIKIPDIEVIDLKKSGEETADIIAKISNDMDEGTVIFQRLRNGIRKNIEGSNQITGGGFSLSPKQTIITGGIFTIGNNIGLYDSLGNEIATIDPKTGEIKINQGFENKVTINVNFNTHIPVVELRDITKNITLFQIVLPIESITSIQMNEGKPNYEQLQLPDGGFGDFNNGYCIKNIKNDCILYTNNAGAIYIPGIYASSLIGEYLFDKTSKNTTFIIKDQFNKAITTLILKIKQTQ